MMLTSRLQTDGKFRNKAGVFCAALIIGLSTLLAGTMTFMLRFQVGPWWSEVLISVIFGGILGVCFVSAYDRAGAQSTCFKSPDRRRFDCRLLLEWLRQDHLCESC